MAVLKLPVFETLDPTTVGGYVRAGYLHYLSHPEQRSDELARRADPRERDRSPSTRGDPVVGALGRGSAYVRGASSSHSPALRSARTTAVVSSLWMGLWRVIGVPIRLWRE
jgi:hypothetical protein